MTEHGRQRLLGLVIAFSGLWAAFVAHGWQLWAALLLTLLALGLLFVGRVPERSTHSTAADSDSPPLAAVVDASPEALLCYSDLGRIVYANCAARDLFLEGGAYPSRNFLELVGSAAPAVREALLGPDDHLFTLELDGWPESYHLARRQLNVQGEHYTWLSVTRMTRPVGRREAELLRRVIRVLSHEVNNSLAPILSLLNSSQRLLETPPSAATSTRVIDLLGTAGERAQHLATFIEGYGRLARLPEPVPRNVQWTSVSEHLQGLYPALKLSFETRPAWFDPVQLEQVLVNLVKNAREAGSAESDIEVQIQVLADGASKLEVLDRGGGFSEPARTQAFVPLYTTKEHGSGMGLALCKDIVEAHGGSIGVSNRNAGGAQVRLVLPGRPGAIAELTASRLTLTRNGSTPGLRAADAR